ncbi:hypothetical protein [Vibrio quintilis]|uniref:Uncharacterized protein n=1 Tax=Vibrio quintilis TaxID=1117707 RepID=A0A1M7YNS6_9VIBR|nr:hypothetical protein [Vibrio quintilis]SHO54313.1 hypothetical protein VQ7734_00025 [Vibrio quintilis]
MSDKKYCAVNTKYYKNSNTGEINHVLRKMLDNVNSVKCLQENNFGYCFSENDDLGSYYEKRLKEAKEKNKYAIQNNSNTFIDSVLVFNSEQFLKCIEENKQDEIEQATKDFMLEFQKEYGFEPIGFEFHLDEGTTIDADKLEELSEDERKKYRPIDNPDEDFTSEYIKHNVHAHAIFLNYDFENNKTCLRDMRKKNWIASQDLLHKHFKKFGFDRGESKMTNKRDHKDKEDYVRELELKTTELIQTTSKHLDEKNDLLDEILDHQQKLDRFENLSNYAQKIKNFFDERPKLILSLEKAFGEKFEEVKQMAIEIYQALTERSEPVKQDLVQEQEIEPSELELAEVPQTVEEQKINNEVKAKQVADKEKKIKAIKNKRKYKKKSNSSVSKLTLKPDFGKK